MIQVHIKVNKTTLDTFNIFDSQSMFHVISVNVSITKPNFVQLYGPE